MAPYCRGVFVGTVRPWGASQTLPPQHVPDEAGLHAKTKKCSTYTNLTKANTFFNELPRLSLILNPKKKKVVKYWQAQPMYRSVIYNLQKFNITVKPWNSGACDILNVRAKVLRHQTLARVLSSKLPPCVPIPAWPGDNGLQNWHHTKTLDTKNWLTRKWNIFRILLRCIEHKK